MKKTFCPILELRIRVMLRDKYSARIPRRTKPSVNSHCAQSVGHSVSNRTVSSLLSESVPNSFPALATLAITLESDPVPRCERPREYNHVVTPTNGEETRPLTAPREGAILVHRFRSDSNPRIRSEIGEPITENSSPRSNSSPGR